MLTPTSSALVSSSESASEVKTTNRPSADVACLPEIEKFAPSNGRAPNPDGRSTSVVEPAGTAAAVWAMAARTSSPRASVRRRRRIRTTVRAPPGPGYRWTTLVFSGYPGDRSGQERLDAQPAQRRLAQPQRPAVQRDLLRDDRQAQAGAVGRHGRGRPAREGLEQPLALLRRDAGPVVVDAH